MAVLTIKFQPDAKDVFATIQQIKESAASLGKTPVKIAVQSTGIEALEKSLANIQQSAGGLDKVAAAATKLAEAQAKAANANARLQAEETKRIQSNNALSAAQEKTKQIELALTAQREKLAAVAERQAKAEANAAQRAQQMAQASQKAGDAAQGAARGLQQVSTATTKVNGEWRRTVDTFSNGFTTIKQTEEATAADDTKFTETITHNYEKRAKAAAAEVKARKNATAQIIASKSREMLELERQVENMNLLIQNSHQRAQAFLAKEKANAAVYRQLLSYSSSYTTGNVSAIGKDFNIDRWLSQNAVSLKTEGNTFKSDESAEIARRYSAAMADIRAQNESTSISFKGLQSGAASAWKTLQSGTKITESLGHTIGSMFTRMATMAAMGTLIYKPVAMMREALSTMKDVDAQLTNIQKVSNATAEHIDRIGDAAYDTASKYGVAADKYLSAVYEFQKAGLGDSAEKLGELAVKTQLVGDTTAGVASKFLIAVNAAWNLNGSVEALSKVVDEADYINNNYATSLDKLSAGMPIVASTAANLGMSVEETMAVIGTITAITQETGNKAATAWRALVMNITGELGEIYDETGEVIEVTEDSVKSISDALKIYGNEAVKAAQASGTIINPMEAVISLANAYRDGLLNDIELENILMGVGGKLRTNQLTALVKDLSSETSIYRDIIASLPNAAGTADTEISIMLSSWESKTQVLKNSFTEMISHLVSSDGIKVVIDALTGVVKAIDSGIGRFAALTGVLYGLAKAVAMLSASGTVTGIVSFFSGLASGALTATEAVQYLWITLSASPLAWVIAIAGAITAVKLAVDALNTTTEEHLEKLDKLSGEYESAQSKLDDLNVKLAENTRLLRAANEAGDSTAYIARLTEENERLQEQIDLQIIAAAKAKEKLRAEAEATLSDQNYTISSSAGSNGGIGSFQFGNMIEYTAHLLELSKTTGDYDEELSGLIQTLAETRDKLASNNEEYEKLTPAQKDLYDEVTEVIDGYRDQNAELLEAEKNARSATDATEELGEASSAAAESAEELAESEEKTARAADLAKKRIEATSSALSDYKNYGDLTTESVDALTDAMPGLLNALFDEEGQLTATGEEALRTAASIDDNTAATKYLQQVADNASLQHVINELNDESIAWANNTARIKENLNARIRALGAEVAAQSAAISNAMDEGSGNSVADMRANNRLYAQAAQLASSNTQLNAYQDALRQIDSYTATWGSSTVVTPPRSSGGGSGSSGGGRSSGGGGRSSASSEKDEQLEALKDIVALEKQRYELLEAQGRPLEERVAQMEAIQTALHEQAEHLRQTNATEEDIKAVSEEWWSWQDKIHKAVQDTLESQTSLLKQQLSFMEASGKPVEERVAKIKEIQSSLHEEAEYLRSIGASEEEILKRSTEWWTLQNEITKIYEEQDKEREEAQKAQLKALQDIVTQLENELALLEAVNASEDERIAKIQEIKAALGNVLNYQNEIGASQSDILSTQISIARRENDITKILEERRKAQEDAKKARLDELKSVVSLLQNELSLLESTDASESLRIAKMREIQRALEEQMRYMKEIGSSQEDIISAALQWYRVQKSITDLAKASLDEANRAAQESFEKYVKAVIANLEDERDRQIDALEALIDEMDERRKAAQETREEEEKILAVMKAQQDLLNAQRNRTIRMYNASSAQWEWVADPQAVSSAEEALSGAQQALDDYRDEQEYNRRREEIEAQIAAINEAADAQIQAWNDAAENVRSGARSIRQAMEDAAAGITNGLPDVANAYSELQTALAAQLSAQASYTSSISAATSAAQAFADFLTSLTNRGSGRGRSGGGSGGGGTGGSGATSSGTRTSYRGGDDTPDRVDHPERAGLAYYRNGVNVVYDARGRATNIPINTHPGMVRAPAYEAVYGLDREERASYGQSVYDQRYMTTADLRLMSQYDELYAAGRISQSYWRSTKDMIRSRYGYSGGVSGEGFIPLDNFENYTWTEDDRLGGLRKNELKSADIPSRAIDPSTGRVKRAAARANGEWDDDALYDSGGLLRGLGGIKATAADELILPPDITKAALSPDLAGRVADRLEEIGFLFGARNSFGAFPVSAAGNRIDTQYSGNVYNINGVDVSRYVTEGTTIRELAAVARNLGIYGRR